MQVLPHHLEHHYAMSPFYDRSRGATSPTYSPTSPRSHVAGLLTNEPLAFPYVAFFLTYVTPLQSTVPVLQSVARYPSTSPPPFFSPASRSALLGFCERLKGPHRRLRLHSTSRRRVAHQRVGLPQRRLLSHLRHPATVHSPRPSVRHAVLID